MASVHATRRWLSLHGHADSTLRGKEDVAMLLARHRPSSERKLNELIAADAAYGQALNACLVHYDRGVYLDALGELSRHVGDTTVFLASLTDK